MGASNDLDLAQGRLEGVDLSFVQIAENFGFMLLIQFYCFRANLLARQRGEQTVGSAIPTDALPRDPSPLFKVIKNEHEVGALDIKGFSDFRLADTRIVNDDDQGSA